MIHLGNHEQYTSYWSLKCTGGISGGENERERDSPIQLATSHPFLMSGHELRLEQRTSKSICVRQTCCLMWYHMYLIIWLPSWDRIMDTFCEDCRNCNILLAHCPQNYVAIHTEETRAWPLPPKDEHVLPLATVWWSLAYVTRSRNVTFDRAHAMQRKNESNQATSTGWVRLSVLTLSANSFGKSWCILKSL